MTSRTAASDYAAQRVFIGTITPSGNTVVERVTLGIVRDLPDVSAHFSRTPVFGSSDPSPERYAPEGFLAAAHLLAHAAPNVLLWNGSKGAGIGFDHDRALVAQIEDQTRIRATTSILGLEALLEVNGRKRLGIVTPYNAEGQRKTLDCLAREGYDIVGDACAGLSDNLSYASVPLDRIADMVRAVAAKGPQAIVCLCTNFPAAVVAAPLESELGVPVFDSTALGVWHALRLAGLDTAPAAARWGSLFGEVP